MTLQKKKVFPGEVDSEIISEYRAEIPEALQQELDAMNSQARSGNGQEQPETDSLAEYRIEILGKAAHIVSQDRNLTYGSPEDSFLQIARLWSAYLGASLLPTDVALMMALLKVARLTANPTSEDSWVDLAGYAACGASAAQILQDDATP